MLYKTTNKLFRGTYQYKIVLVCAGAPYLRSGDMDAALMSLRTLVPSDIPNLSRFKRKIIKTQEELDYSIELCEQIKKIGQCEIRVESPWVSIYTNDKSALDQLANINQENVKYIAKPPEGMELVQGSIVLSGLAYDYRVTVGRTLQNYSAFVEWADANSAKTKLTKSCRNDLLKEKSWGGAYFYISGENALLMAKMMLGSVITKVEKITQKITPP